MPWRVATAVAAAALSPAADLYNSRDSLIVQNQNVVFPSDLRTTNGTPYIHMKFSKYTRRSIYDQPFFQPQNSIRLPIPSQLVDNVSVRYSPEELGPLVGAAIDSISGINPNNLQESLNRGIGVGVGAGAQALLTAPTAAAGTAGAVGAITGTASGQAAAQLGRAGAQAVLDAAQVITGITINPFQTVLFKSPNFKTHKFSWTLVPKTAQESKDLEFIIRLFKYHMLPGISGPGTGGVFFSYPEILEIKLFPKDDYLYKFKPCVVDNISVNYAPNNPSFYKETGAPTAVQFSVSLQEIEIWTKADYVRENGRPRAQTSPDLRTIR